MEKPNKNATTIIVVNTAESLWFKVGLCVKYFILLTRNRY